MSELFFLIQSRGGSKNIVHSGGKLVTKEYLCNQQLMSEVVDDMRYGCALIKYAEVGCYFDSLKSMSVEVFRQSFSYDDIARMQYLLEYDSTKGFGETLFSKEVHTTFGRDISEGKIMTQLIPKSKLQAGHIYLDKDNKMQWLYLGDVSFDYVFDDKSGSYQGNMFLDYTHYLGRNKLNNGSLLLTDFIADIISSGQQDKLLSKMFIKGAKKVVADLGVESQCCTIYSRDFSFSTKSNIIYRYPRKGTFRITQRR